MPRRPSAAVPCGVSAAAALVLAACAPSAPPPPTVGLITKTATNPFFVKMREGAAAAARARGLRLLTAAGRGDGDNLGQVAALETMVAAGARVVLLTAGDARAIVPAVRRARARGVVVLALDSPTDPPAAVDALYATDNYEAGQLVGRYARAALGTRPPRVVTLDLLPGHPVGAQRHNGFLAGLGVASLPASSTRLARPAELRCAGDTFGDAARAQTVMENCLQRAPDANVVYTINEPAAGGAHRALAAAGKAAGVVLVSVDGSCRGVRDVAAGAIAATAQQYPVRMAELGVAAAADYYRTGKKPAGYTNTGVALVTARPLPGVRGLDARAGAALCFGR